MTSPYLAAFAPPLTEAAYPGTRVTLEARLENVRIGQESSSQALGRAASAAGASGLLVRSAAVARGINVVVFPHTHRDNRMKVVEGEKLARLGVRLRA